MTTTRRWLDARLVLRLDKGAVVRLDTLVNAGPPGLNRSDVVRGAIQQYLQEAGRQWPRKQRPETRPDIAEAKRKMRSKFGGGREIKRLTEHLYEGELVARITAGSYGKGFGLLVPTDRGLLFFQDGILSKTSEDFPIGKITSVQWSSGVLQGTVVVFASGNKAEIQQVDKNDGKEIVDLVRRRLSAPPPVIPAPAAPVSAATPDVMGQLSSSGSFATPAW